MKYGCAPHTSDTAVVECPSRWLFFWLLLLLHETNESKVTLSKITVNTADRDKLDRIGGSSCEGELGCVQRDALTVLGLQLCAKGN